MIISPEFDSETEKSSHGTKRRISRSLNHDRAKRGSYESKVESHSFNTINASSLDLQNHVFADYVVVTLPGASVSLDEI